MTRARSQDAACSRDLAVAAAPTPALRRQHRRRVRQARLTGLVRLLVFLFLIFVAVWAGVRVANASGDSAVFEGTRYEVRAGDTLWSIAAAHYGDHIDLRKAVYDIQRQNDLSGALVQPGQNVVLPFEGDDGAARSQ